MKITNRAGMFWALAVILVGVLAYLVIGAVENDDPEMEQQPEIVRLPLTAPAEGATA